MERTKKLLLPPLSNTKTRHMGGFLALVRDNFEYQAENYEEYMVLKAKTDNPFLINLAINLFV